VYSWVWCVYCTEDGIGLRLVSMRRRTNASSQLITAAYVSAIVPGSAADRLHGELSEGRSRRSRTF